MVEKLTSKILLTALKRKFDKAAVLKEVTMTDEEEETRVATAIAISSPGYKKYLDRKGLRYDAELPDDYNYRTAITTRRIDALIFDGNQRTAVEIKISRGDFFRDTPEKRYAWKKHSHRFVYLTPQGLVKPEEVAEDCGLWEYHDGKITVIKRAKINKNVVDFPASMTKYFAWRAFIAEEKLAKFLK
jgi:hypothetical protein